VPKNLALLSKLDKIRETQCLDILVSNRILRSLDILQRENMDIQQREQIKSKFHEHDGNENKID